MFVDLFGLVCLLSCHAFPRSRCIPEGICWLSGAFQLCSGTKPYHFSPTFLSPHLSPLLLSVASDVLTSHHSQGSSVRAGGCQGPMSQALDNTCSMQHAKKPLATTSDLQLLVLVGCFKPAHMIDHIPHPDAWHAYNSCTMQIYAQARTWNSHDARHAVVKAVIKANDELLADIVQTNIGQQLRSIQNDVDQVARRRPY